MFKDRDIVCFLGDSITANGLWQAEVYQILKKKYKIKCYNCGVSGATAETSIGYLYSECLIYNPDYVVLMLGMNDFNMGLYSKNSANLVDLKERQEERFNIHTEKYETIIKECKEFGAEVIICLPTPYDDITEYDAEVLSYQQPLNKAADFQIVMAEKYGCNVVNFKDNMRLMLGKRKIIREDRVHPTEDGYHIMAQLFLKELNEINECDFDTPFEFEDWNKLRYDAEMQNHKLNFIELNDTYFDGYAKDKSVDEIKEIAKKRLDAYDGDSVFIQQAYQEYIEKGHMRSKNRGKTIKYTIF